jgi:hypothetical protein
VDKENLKNDLKDLSLVPIYKYLFSHVKDIIVAGRCCYFFEKNFLLRGVSSPNLIRTILHLGLLRKALNILQEFYLSR